MKTKPRLPSLAAVTAAFCCLTLLALAVPLVVMAGNGMTNVMVSRADRDMVERLAAEAAIIEGRLGAPAGVE